MKQAVVSLLLLALALCALPVSGNTQEQEEDAYVRCTKCKNVGRIECGEHRKLDMELELGVEYCSFVATCETCLGAGWVDCEHCENPVTEARLEAKRARSAVVHAELQFLDDTMERPLRKVAVPHAVIVCEIESWKVKKKRLKPHTVAHLYAGRVDALIKDYMSVLGVGPEEFAERLKVLIWGYQDDHEEGARRFMEISGKTGVKLLGIRPGFSVAQTREHFDNDEEFHRCVVHNVTHLLLSHQAPALWVGNIKGGWADAGVAHWFEERIEGICDNYCYQEVDLTNQRGFNGGEFRVGLRKALAKDTLPSVAQVLTMNTDTMTEEMNALAFAIVDYLMNLDPAKTNELFKLMRARHSTRDALKTVFSINPIQLETRVLEWIRTTYPTR